MGMLGRYIDSLTPEQKDRVIEARDWCTKTLGKPGEPRCLMGHAKNAYDFSYGDAFYAIRLAIRFDTQVQRHGMQRIVRAIKLRAGKPQPILREVPQQNKLLHNNLTTVGG